MSKHQLTDDQVAEGVEQVKAHLAAQSASRGAAGAHSEGECDCPDHVIESAVRAGAAAAPAGKIDFAQIMQIIMAVLAAIGPLLPKKPA